jgi:hypothetical protein
MARGSLRAKTYAILEQNWLKSALLTASPADFETLPPMLVPEPASVVSVFSLFFSSRKENRRGRLAGYSKAS